jgi:SAM-dependent methyltransferase
MAELAEVRSGMRVIDVGCGPGVLTGELAARVGPAAVSAIDPSEQFVAAARERHPEVDVQRASAEHLPYSGGTFDAALAQLVVHFMTDPLAGLTEMRRVTRPGGNVAACVWDHAGGRGPLSVFWEAARALDPTVEDGSQRAGASEGSLEELFASAGLHDVEGALLSVTLEQPSFEEWWLPYTFGVGPGRSFMAALDSEQVAELRERCRALLPEPPFRLTFLAWAARGTAP